MSATNLFIGWSAAVWSPATGSPVTITRVTDVKVNRDASAETFKGDLAKFTQAIAVPMQKRTITVTSADIAALMAIPQGADGGFSVKLADSKNGIAAGGGGVTITLTSCVVMDNTANGQHAKFGSAQITFEGYSADGSTDPLTVAAL